MKLKDVKTYVKEHKMEIAIALTGSSLLALGSVIGWTGCMKRNGLKSGDLIITDKTMKTVIEDAIETYPNMSYVFTEIAKKPLRSDELGKLGEVIRSLGTTDEITFTHFIAIGESVQK